jgi:hypothetical protein
MSKIMIIPMALAVFILPVDVANAQVVSMKEYNPVMLNLATLFDFDAFRGPVRTFESTLKDADGKTVFRASGAFNQQGCIEYFKTEDGKGVNHDYKRSGDRLVSQINHQDVMTLTKDCLLESNTTNGSTMTYTYDANKLMHQILLQPSNTLLSLHQYNSNHLPTDIRFFINGMTASRMEITYEDEKNRPYDYILKQSYTIGNGESYMKRKCQYDVYANPASCTLTMAKDKDFSEITWVRHVHSVATWFE